MSTTSCPCPNPPGGSVTCEGRQLAYCQIVDGEVRSGCIPIPNSTVKPPTKDKIVGVFNDVLKSAGYDQPLDYTFYLTERESSERLRFSSPSRDRLPDFLQFAMQNGLTIGFIYSLVEIVLIRFPHIWIRGRSGEGAEIEHGYF